LYKKLDPGISLQRSQRWDFSIFPNQIVSQMLLKFLNTYYKGKVVLEP